MRTHYYKTEQIEVDVPEYFSTNEYTYCKVIDEKRALMINIWEAIERYTISVSTISLTGEGINEITKQQFDEKYNLALKSIEKHL